MCLQDSDDATSEPRSSVSGGQTVGESSASQVVGIGMDYYPASQNAVGTNQRDERILVRELSHSRVVRLDIAQVTNVSVVQFVRAAVFVLKTNISIINALKL